MLATCGETLEGKRCVVSGSGNVASYAAEKLMQLGAKVLTLSDRSGTLVFSNGLTAEQLAAVMELKNVKRGEFAELKMAGAKFVAKKNPWQTVSKYDCAFPCSRQNELDGKDAAYMLKNGVKLVRLDMPYLAKIQDHRESVTTYLQLD
jgi:glutamate dehydrogenase (NADP+)